VQIIPAIDLKDNKCVRLTKGEDDTSIVFNEEPEKQAMYFQEKGCKKLHIVDLDAAFGRPDINLPSIIKIRKSISIPIQLGGGIRSETDLEKYINLGIENLIIGSMAVKEPEKLKILSNKHKNKIYVSLDIINNSVMVRGWKEKSTLKIEDVINLYNDTNIKGYILTDIQNDGMLKGLNTVFIKNIVSKIEKNDENKNAIIAGGLTNYQDLINLKNLNLRNIEGIISGKSFYVGNIDLAKAQKILDNNG
tara:strand:- start:10334 stop:11080 length:747 start_codon:yes stop_codon:yes gene_type:complete